MASSGGLLTVPDAIFPMAFRPFVQRIQFYANCINKA